MKYSIRSYKGINISKILAGRNGSSIVMLAIIFVGFALCLAGAVGISRRLVVSSACDSYGSMWTKAILSEYDIHLLEDYELMAFFGNDDEITDKLNSYLMYSAHGRMEADIKGANADLTGYELGDPENFKNAMKLAFMSSAASELINGQGRTFRNLDEGDEDEGTGRVINSRVVLDTLPSNGTGGSISAETLTEKARSVADEEGLKDLLVNRSTEVLMLTKHFNSHVTASDDDEHFFINEWEYVIKGSNDDEVNYRACRRRLFAARNALNLVSLYKDPDKVEAIVTVAETITPGPLGMTTQLLIAEAWAALETEEDLETLYTDGRVPVIKTADQWKTDLRSVLKSSKVEKELDEESKELLTENSNKISNLSDGIKTVKQFRDGLSYDEYLMIMVLAMNENVRLLRIMDLVQINMKYRYYRDFNLMEYYIGTRFTIEVNGNSHVFEDSYK